MACLSLALALCLVADSPAQASPEETWPQWRGPTGDSVAAGAGLPTHWSQKDNVVWKTPLPGWGDSTPAIWQDAIFVTTQDKDRLLLLRSSAERQHSLVTRSRSRYTTPLGPGRQWPF